MTTSTAPTLHIRGPLDLVAAVPYLLGFAPERSLVLIGLEDNRVIVTARMDLADVYDENERFLVEETLVALKRGGTTNLVALIYSDACAPEMELVIPYFDVIGRVRRDCASSSIELDEALLLANGRYWSYVCENAECCPLGGKPIEENLEVAATAVAAGLVAQPSREAMVAALDPLPGHERLLSVLAPTGLPEPGEINSVKREPFRLGRMYQQHSRLIEDEYLVKYGTALQCISVRDALWLAIDIRRLECPELMLFLARSLPGRYAAPPLFLYAWSRWREGDGAMAMEAVTRAVAADPSYTAADLLVVALKEGIDPRTMPKLKMDQRG